MKIATKIVLDWDGQILEKEEFEYEGPIAECKGGSTSGKVDWPDYIKETHADWMTSGAGSGGTPNTRISSNITSVMSSSMSSNPYSGKNAYDPTADIALMSTKITGFKSLIESAAGNLSWDYLIRLCNTTLNSIAVDPGYTAVPDILGLNAVNIMPSKLTAITGIKTDLGSDVDVDAAVDAFADKLDEQIEDTVLPRFEAGMLDMGAVLTSAFVVGKAIIESRRNTDVSKFQSDLRIALAQLKDDAVAKAYISRDNLVGQAVLNHDQYKAQAYMERDRIRMESEDRRLKWVLMGLEPMVRLLLQYHSFQESIAKTFVEIQRMKIVAMKEQKDRDVEIDAAEGTWRLSVFEYGANVMAAISGGAGTPVPKKPSQMASAIGGALTGAASGAMIGAAIAPASAGVAATATTGAIAGTAGGGPIGAGIGALLGAAAAFLM